MIKSWHIDTKDAYTVNMYTALAWYMVKSIGINMIFMTRSTFYTCHENPLEEWDDQGMMVVEYTVTSTWIFTMQLPIFKKSFLPFHPRYLF